MFWGKQRELKVFPIFTHTHTHYWIYICIYLLWHAVQKIISLNILKENPEYTKLGIY